MKNQGITPNAVTYGYYNRVRRLLSIITPPSGVPRGGGEERGMFPLPLPSSSPPSSPLAFEKPPAKAVSIKKPVLTILLFVCLLLFWFDSEVSIVFQCFTARKASWPKVMRTNQVETGLNWEEKMAIIL